MKDKQWLLEQVKKLVQDYDNKFRAMELDSQERINLVGQIEGLYSVQSLINQLEEPKKPVVPKFVADWFEENKRELEYEIYNVISEISSKDTSEQSEIEQWFDANILNGKNHYPIEIAIRMQDGYTVEKEPLYYAKIKGADKLPYIFPTYLDLYVSNTEVQLYKSLHTKQAVFPHKKSEWRAAGINDDNASFEEVED